MRVGLSPRLRGNLFDYIPGEVNRGSIPALAGEPRFSKSVSRCCWVYPRACGGTSDPVLVALNIGGLSPRLRGNQLAGLAVRRSPRSIPALAGEPCPAEGAASAWGVYPRACGGTSAGHQVRPVRCGLSPRLRGNHRRTLVPPRISRSIPALAGEPTNRRISPCGGRVYPRACGGTVEPPGPTLSEAGLSPRLRGNQLAVRPSGAPRRSIPALAGEPRLAGLQ